MRIVTWNCNGAYRKKEDVLISRLNPDIVIIQECEKPGHKYKSQYPYHLWIGDNVNKGLGIFSLTPIDEIEIRDNKSKYYLPFIVENTLFFSFWTKNDVNSPRNRYIGQAFNVMSCYLDMLPSNCVIIGDLNWNVCWDDGTQRNPVSGTLAELNVIFSQYNILSAYHAQNNIEFGFEKNPTLFLYRKKERPYHVDYIYLSKTLQENLQKLEIGAFDDWIQYSDHMPVYADICLSNLSNSELK